MAKEPKDLTNAELAQAAANAVRVLIQTGSPVAHAALNNIKLEAVQRGRRLPVAKPRHARSDAAWKSEGRLRSMEGHGNYEGSVTWP